MRKESSVSPSGVCNAMRSKESGGISKESGVRISLREPAGMLRGYIISL